MPPPCAALNPHSPLRGTPNVLIFPTLNAANIPYTLTMKLAKVEAFGPIVVGGVKHS